MTHLFIYRMTSDTGFAPCVDNGLLTLACCKGGQIRAGKIIHTGLRYRIGARCGVDYTTENVYVLGTYENKFLYLARVKNVITMEEYYSGVSTGRTDDIYSMKDGILVRNDKLYKEEVHIEDGRIIRDLAGKYVLVSDDYIYLGRDAVFIDLIAKKNARFQETKSYHGESAEGIIEECLKYRDGRQHEPIAPYNKRGCCR